MEKNGFNMGLFVKQVIEMCGYSIPQYCEMIGVSKQSFYAKLRNNSFNTKDLEKLEKALGIRLTMGAFLKDGKVYTEKVPAYLYEQ